MVANTQSASSRTSVLLTLGLRLALAASYLSAVSVRGPGEEVDLRRCQHCYGRVVTGAAAA
jgi:hypothetical protein